MTDDKNKDIGPINISNTNLAPLGVASEGINYINSFTNQVVKELKRTSGKKTKKHVQNEITGLTTMETMNGGHIAFEVAPGTKLSTIGLSYAGRRLLDLAIMDITSKVSNKERGLYTPQDIIKYTTTLLDEDLISETFDIGTRQTRNNIIEAVKDLATIRDVQIPLRATLPKKDKNGNPIKNRKTGELIKETKNYTATFKSLVSVEFSEQNKDGTGTPKAIIWDANFLAFIINSSNICPKSKEAFKINGQRNQNAYDMIRFLEEDAHMNQYKRCVVMHTLFEYCPDLRTIETLRERRENVYERLIKPVIRDLTSLITTYGLLEELVILDEEEQGVLLSYKLDNTTGTPIQEVKHPTEFKSVKIEDFVKLKIRYKLKGK